MWEVIVLALCCVGWCALLLWCVYDSTVMPGEPDVVENVIDWMRRD